MTGPELGAAAERLAAEGLLAPEPAARLRRMARRELVSVRGGLRLLLTAGVLLAATGVGLFVKEHAERIGPLAIAAGLTALAAGALAFAFHGAPPFTRGEAPERGALCQAMLLLGALLLATDLAWIETRLKLLGPQWPYHLLAVALAYGALAYRHDSRALLSMALASFAGWRGVSRDLPLDALLGRADGVRANALICAAVFALGAWHAGRGFKRHFEPVWSNFAILLLLSGLATGALGERAWWGAWAALLGACGVAVALAARRRRRPLWFAQGAAAAWLAACRAMFGVLPTTSALLGAALASLGFFVLLVRETRGLGGEEEP